MFGARIRELTGVNSSSDEGHLIDGRAYDLLFDLLDEFLTERIEASTTTAVVATRGPEQGDAPHRP